VFRSSRRRGAAYAERLTAWQASAGAEAGGSGCRRRRSGATTRPLPAAVGYETSCETDSGRHYRLTFVVFAPALLRTPGQARRTMIPISTGSPQMSMPAFADIAASISTRFLPTTPPDAP
jgi:hypothetical protein